MFRNKIVVTENISKLVAMFQSLKNKAERVERVGLGFAPPGYGKSTAVEYVYTHNPSYYVRASAAWSKSVNMMVEDILRCYRVEARGRLKWDLRELILIVKKKRVPLFIDEADRVVKKSILIEIIRDIHDLTRVPIILIGGENILNLLQRKELAPVFSRITEVVEFRPLSEQSIQDISEELCDLECNLKVASLVRTVTLGDFRLVNAFLTKAETLCTLNKTNEISLAIAKEASKVLPRPDDFNRAVRRENIGFNEPQSLRAAK